MGNRLFIMMIFLGMLSFPHCLIGSDIFGNFTYQGKAVDADTLKPIEGAVVVAKWYNAGQVLEPGRYVISAWPRKH